MESKMTKEQGERINVLKEDIRVLQIQINEKMEEIDRTFVEAGADFENSYVEFYNGEEYVFMRVERQIIRSGGCVINLKGPSIRLNTNPLDEDYEEGDGFDWGSYDETDDFSFGPQVLQGLTIESIHKITKKDMTFVLDYYMNTLKKNLI